MKLVKAKFLNGVLTPETPIPKNSVRSEFNGTDFVVYESQDEVMYGGAPYIQEEKPKPLKYPKMRNFISRIQGFFIRLKYKVEDAWQRRQQ